MAKFAPVKINNQYSINLNEDGNVELHRAEGGIAGSMSYYYTRNDLPLFICRNDPSANLRTIHDVMVQLDDQMEQMVDCGCLKVGGQNVAIRQSGAL